ncbi:MAG: uroporphyrinogen-III synthase [Pseudomonadota bacterium]
MNEIILTRPKQQAEHFAHILRSKTNSTVHLMPLIAIKACSDSLKQVDDVVLFTSANAIPFVARGQGQLALCVGDATCEAAKLAGFDAHSANGTAQDLAKLILMRADVNLRRFYHPHGAQVSDGFHETLEEGGIQLFSEVVYRQETQIWSKAQTLLVESRPFIFPVFSPNGARVLAQNLAEIGPQSHRIVAISEDAGKPLIGFDLLVAEKPSRYGVLEAVLEMILRGESFEA